VASFLTDRSFIRYVVISILFVMVAMTLASSDHFWVIGDGTRTLVSRQAHPVLFGGSEASLILIAVASALLALRRAVMLRYAAATSDTRRHIPRGVWIIVAIAVAATVALYVL
jgi:hypothetical protein